MQSAVTHARRKLVEYDSIRRRLWILGQRCHHGAGGVVVTATACFALALDRQVAPAFVALAATGGVLMAHDWKDHAIWFERGYGTQP
jgi:hypothetical protein